MHIIGKFNAFVSARAHERLRACRSRGVNVNVCACVVRAIRMRTHSRSNLHQGDAARMIDCFHDVNLVLQCDRVEVGVVAHQRLHSDFLRRVIILVPKAAYRKGSPVPHVPPHTHTETHMRHRHYSSNASLKAAACVFQRTTRACSLQRHRQGLAEACRGMKASARSPSHANSRTHAWPQAGRKCRHALVVVRQKGEAPSTGAAERARAPAPRTVNQRYLLAKRVPQRVAFELHHSASKNGPLPTQVPTVTLSYL
jgi:hypothetical protein